MKVEITDQSVLCLCLPPLLTFTFLRVDMAVMTLMSFT